MDAATTDELSELRARAYGPGADIDGDPEALRRLRELEGLGRPEPLPDAVPTPVPDAVPNGATAEPAPVPFDAAPASAAPSTRSSRRTTDRRGRRRLPLVVRILWPVSVAVIAALAAWATFALVSIAPVATSNGARQVATLTPTDAVEVPAGFLGAGPSSATYEFFGLVLFETAGGYVGTQGADCFAAAGVDQLPEAGTNLNQWSYSGPIFSGCRIGSFPATLQMPIDSGVPQQLRDEFPDGGALQFIRDGDRIGVFLSEADSSPESTPNGG